MSNLSFQKVEKTVGLSDFRASLATHLAKAREKPLIVSARRSEDSFIVLSVDAYNALVEVRENEIDSRELVRLVKANKGKKRIPWKR
ncbi:hypothetical protein A3A39_00890 [Candidatus Kaiserbacteria bacterium RIFCSPLOWO2_01_FULL_54_13]|uniref:Antitoxin n=1 Tax=Candidatus Kaiserbacteria bacterium RIFCSPLOWO2_01_FULL_54_13 TaxID=1798512 RepID=A0A1F6F1R7_9BACT|nr:MAG: hypothetical protein A3A39_00890 [Candidatus Kaiserbacteria bacterium RIFCSPLOWO2_01_FULL_54_13]